MSETKQILLRRQKNKYPSGRAFKLPPPEGSPPDGGELYRLHRALNINKADAFDAALGIFSARFPTDPDFTIDDAHAWYERLGIYDSFLVPLADMKLAIARKLSFPLVPLNKQSPEYIQQQLQAAGFDLYIYKNYFLDASPPGAYTKSPGVVLGGVPAGEALLGNFTLGDVYLNQHWSDSGISICANYLDESQDAQFVIYPNLKSTFYVAGATITTFANVDVNRRVELRQLLMQLKSAEMVAYMFINYI